MYGAIIGDIIGSSYERRNRKTREFPLFTTASTYTDDTVMTVAVARALISYAETGAIAEAYFGIPEEIFEQAMAYLDEDPAVAVDECLAYFEG